MNDFQIITGSTVTEADLKSARPGQRFGRLDLQSQLAVLAVSSLRIDFEVFNRERIGICLSTSAGSLTTDFNFWESRKEIGGPSPTLFAYTLPSAAVGEIAIHFKIKGPNICFVADDKYLLAESKDMIVRGDADACISIHCDVISSSISDIISTPPIAKATATFLRLHGAQKA